MCFFLPDYFRFEPFKKRNDRQWRSLFFNKQANINGAVLLVPYSVPFDTSSKSAGPLQNNAKFKNSKFGCVKSNRLRHNCYHEA